MSDTPTPASAPSPLLSLPPEILLDDIIPRLNSADITSLSYTSKLFHSLCNDGAVWRTKMEHDFSFFAPHVALGRGNEGASWYQRVYKGLERPRTYLWGEAGQARLGSLNDIAARTRAPRLSFIRHVDKPMNVTDWFTGRTAPSTTGLEKSDPTVSMVDLQAAGWSFMARDATGGVWAWGQLDGSNYAADNDWANPAAIVEDAARIPLPCSATAIATGRRHLVVLDQDNLIWEMKSWGKAYHHTAPELTAPSHTGAGAPGRRAHIIQVDAGWNFSTCLTAAGDIHYWKPFQHSYNLSLTPQDKLNGPLGSIANRRLKWGTVGPDVVVTLPSIPNRPAPPGFADEKKNAKDLFAAEKAFQAAEDAANVDNMTAEQKADYYRVIKIAATNDNVLALRANGEVWVGTTDASSNAPNASNEQWEYLAYFSSPKITHISAQWTNLFTYATSSTTDSRSAVFSGRCENFAPGIGWNLKPKPLPGLEDLHIIRVVAGDWHYAALTADGAMYAWGKNDRGQCGIPEKEVPGEAIDRADHLITRPVRVSFPPDGDRQAFVFGITAAGMHTGALVLGHPRGKDELPPIAKVASPGPDHDLVNEEEAREVTNNPFRYMPNLRGIRIGFAGRGMRRGMPPPRGGGPPL